MNRGRVPNRIAHQARMNSLREAIGLPVNEEVGLAKGMAKILKGQADPGRPSPLADRWAHLDRLDRLRRAALAETPGPIPEAKVRARRS